MMHRLQVILNYRPTRIAVAGVQIFVAFWALISISLRIFPAPVERLAAITPPFAVGTFTPEYLYLGVCIHCLIILTFGLRAWSWALGMAAQLALALVFFGIGIQAFIEVLVLSLHHLGLNAFGVEESYRTYELGGFSFFSMTILQQPLIVAIVLPSAVMCFISIENLIVATQFEDFAIMNIHRTGGEILSRFFYFARVFNHVAHVVLPMTKQVLREEAFGIHLRKQLKESYQLFFLSEAAAGNALNLFNRMWRASCGVILMSIEYVPLWSSEIVDMLLEGETDG